VIVQLTPVTSSNVKAIGYDAASQVLAVQFGTGAYQYLEVGAEKWAAIQDCIAEGRSIGAYISGQIVRNHKHRKVEVEA
jgi:hypothetical protein